MEQGDDVVPLTFRPLLDRICLLLGFGHPIYSRSLAAVHECCAVVRRSDSAHSFVCLGGDEGSFGESAERAARRLCFFLVEEYSLRVEDVSLGIWEEVESTCSDFRLRRVQLECVERGECSLLMDDQPPVVSSLPLGPSLCIDFYSLLEKVVSKYQISLTPVEYLQYKVNDYKAYLSVCMPSCVPMVKWMRSDRCVSMMSAKQSLSKKVLLFLMPVYRFQVDDINFLGMRRASILLGLERESYLAVKERVYGVQEDMLPKAVLKEEAELTPKGVEFAIAQPLSLPRPPKKRLHTSVSRSFSDVVPQDLIPSVLDRVVARRKSEHE